MVGVNFSNMLWTLCLALDNFAHIDDDMLDALYPNEDHDEMRQWFSSYDRDFDMRLSGHEIMFGLLHENIEEEEKHGTFSDFSKSEFYNDPKRLYDEVDEILREFDANNDGFVDLGEYLKGMSALQ